jgi:hypothetical protein
MFDGIGHGIPRKLLYPFAGRVAETGRERRRIQNPSDRIGQGLFVSRGDVGADDFAIALDIARYDRSPGSHRFEQDRAEALAPYGRRDEHVGAA